MSRVKRKAIVRYHVFSSHLQYIPSNMKNPSIHPLIAILLQWKAIENSTSFCVIVVVVIGRGSHSSSSLCREARMLHASSVGSSSICGRSKEGTSTKALLGVSVEHAEGLSALTLSVISQATRENELDTVE